MAKLDLLLVNPHQPPYESMLKNSAGTCIPLGLAYIAAYVKKKGFEVQILDNNNLDLSLEDFKCRIQEKKPMVVGFTMYAPSVNYVYDFAEAVKKINRDTKVVIGGALATSLYEDVLKSDLVDIVVRGEGEQTTAELLEVIKANGDIGQVKGIAYREKGEIRLTGQRELIEDIDQIPFPAFELLDMDRYSLSPPRSGGRSKNTASIVTSRGCPFLCTFCSNIFGKRIRYRSVENVIEEIKYLKKQYSVEELVFWDDNFLLDEGRAIELCRSIIDNDLKILWSCNSRVDRAADKLYKILYQAGCRVIFFGAESGSQRILDSIGKGVKVENIQNAVSLCKKHKLLSFCSFMLGVPEDDKRSIGETIKFAKKINPDYAFFTLFVPMPGSKIFDELRQSRVIDFDFYNIKWENFSIHFSSRLLPFEVCKVKKDDLIKLQKKALREFYFRPSKIIRFIRNIRSFEQIKLLFKGFFSLLTYQFCKVR